MIENPLSSDSTMELVMKDGDVFEEFGLASATMDNDRLDSPVQSLGRPRVKHLQLCSLTGEKPDGEIDTNDNELKPLSTRFCEAISTKNDLAKLVEDAHMHKCNNFCLRSKKRRCVRCCFSFRKCHNLQSIGQYCATNEFRQFQFS